MFLDEKVVVVVTQISFPFLHSSFNWAWLKWMYFEINMMKQIMNEKRKVTMMFKISRCSSTVPAYVFA